MRSDSLARHLKHFRDLTSRPPSTSSDGALLRTASRLARDLDEDQREAASTAYLLRLLKDQHREAVASIERSASRAAVLRPLAPPTPEQAARRAELHQKTEEECARIEEEHWGRMTEIMQRYSERLKMQWTAELLNSTFALPDGTLVAWGDATVEQHTVRRDMLLANAQGNLRAAARHEAAMNTLDDHGATRLYDLPVAA